MFYTVGLSLSCGNLQYWQSVPSKRVVSTPSNIVILSILNAWIHVLKTIFYNSCSLTHWLSNNPKPKIIHTMPYYIMEMLCQPVGWPGMLKPFIYIYIHAYRHTYIHIYIFYSYNFIWMQLYLLKVYAIFSTPQNLKIGLRVTFWKLNQD